MKRKIIIMLLLSLTLSLVLIPTMCIGETNKQNGDCFAEYVTEFHSGVVLKANNQDSRHEIASMVKIMTANLVFEALEKGQISLEQKVVISHEASSMGGSQMFLDLGSEYTISDLIKGVIVASANDGAVALAEVVAGSHSQFVHKMNERAKELGMNNTMYANATGLPSQSEQYSTAKDVNIVTRQLMSHNKYFEYASIWMEDFYHPSGRVTQLTNTNKLIRFYSGCIGGKTGYTSSAGHCLSAGATRNGLTVVATVIGAKDSKTRFDIVKTLFDYGFGNYKNKAVYSAGQNIDEVVKIKGGKQKTIQVSPTKDVNVLCDKDSQLSQITINLPEQVKAPIQKGDIVGSITVTTNENNYTIDLIASSGVEKATIWDKIKMIFEKF